MELHQQVGQVKTKEDLAAFIAALRLDLAANPEEWENHTLERFLEAMEAWIRDMDGYFKNMGQPVVDVPNWRTLAHIVCVQNIRVRTTAERRVSWRNIAISPTTGVVSVIACSRHLSFLSRAAR